MTGKMFKMCAIGAAALGMAVMTTQDVRAAVTYRTVALTGDAAPGTSPGVVYSSLFTHPVINGFGQVVFRGLLTGTGVDGTNNAGIWSDGSGSLGLVARDGDAALGTEPGVQYIGLFASRINGAGRIAFKSTLTGPGVDNTNDRGIWSEGSGSLNLVMREGNAAPDTEPGVVYNLVHVPLFNGAGQTAFVSFLTGPGVDNTNDRGIWSEGSGSLGLVAREGAAAPGTGPGVVYINLNGPVFNGAGQTAFNSHLTGPGVDFTNDTAIWSEGGGVLHMIAREGDAAPGTEAGVVFGHEAFNVTNRPRINGAGQIAFRSSLTGPGVDGNDTGIWSEGDGSLHLIARRGFAAPGTEPGVVFGSFDTPSLNAAGQVAFSGSLTGPGVDATNINGIWSEGSGSLSLIARMGDTAPGTEPGVVFGFISGGDSPSFNGAGQTVFSGKLTGPGVDSTNDAGIWVADPDGLLTLIVRKGDQFDVNDDPLINDLRTIAGFRSVGFPEGIDDGGTDFNDAGQLALSIAFTDGSEGIFVATIPEPGTLGVLVVGVGLILGKR